MLLSYNNSFAMQWFVQKNADLFYLEINFTEIPVAVL